MAIHPQQTSRPSVVPLIDIDMGWGERAKRCIDWDRLEYYMAEEP